MVLCQLAVIFMFVSPLYGMTLHVFSLDASNFDEFKNSDGINLVYFFRQVKDKDVRYQSKQFLKQYELSASIVENYEVRFAKVDCDVHRIAHFCDSSDVNKAVQVFRSGKPLLSLALESMFDVDSIVSNVLQMVLLRTVPITQSVQERLDFVSKFRSSYDFFFSYHNAIGTPSHRIVMEVAYAYQHQYKFLITTEMDVVRDLRDFKPEDEAAIWHVKCVGVQAGDPCEVYKYKDNMDLSSLARFVQAVRAPFMHTLEKGENNPFAELGLHTVFMFCAEGCVDVARDAQLLKEEFFGLVGVLLIDVEKVEAGKFGFAEEHMSLPTVAFQYRGDKLMNMMPANGDTVMFVNNHLSRVLKSVTRIQTDGSLPAHVPSFDDESYDLTKATEMEEIETQDDQVAAAVNHLKKTKIDRQYVPALNDKTFYSETADRDLLMVLFYLQFDPRSMMTLRHFSAASYTLASHSLFPLAAVDCFDWTDVCAKVNVTHYPTLRTYRAGREPVKYTGVLSAQAVEQSIHIYRANSPIDLQTAEEYESFVTGEFPDYIGLFTNLSFIGLFESKASMEYDMYMKAALEREGKFVFAYAIGDLAREIVSRHARMTLPMVYAERRHDRFLPHQKFTGAWTSDILHKFIDSAPLALFPELTVTNFPLYMAQRKPFVVLFTDNTEGEGYQTMVQLVTEHKYPQLTLCWMNTNEVIAQQLLVEYSPAASIPALTLVSHEAGTVHNYNGVSMATEKVSAWIEAVLDNKLFPSKHLVEKEWKPTRAGYDFLKLIDEEEEEKRRKELSQHPDETDGIGNDEGGEVYEYDQEADSSIRMELANKLRFSRISDSTEERGKRHKNKEGRTEVKKNQDNMAAHGAGSRPTHTEL